jgi:Flp pilus assembly protein TadG
MSDSLKRLRRELQSGQAIVWAAVMLPLFLSVVGLAIDGGIVFDNRRELQNVADSAARAGATQVDVNVYRASAGQSVVLDQASAQQAATQYLTSQGSRLSGTVTTDSQHVVVGVNRSVSTSFLRIVGINNVQVLATATAEVQHGITQGTTG